MNVFQKLNFHIKYLGSQAFYVQFDFKCPLTTRYGSFSGYDPLYHTYYRS